MLQRRVDHEIRVSRGRLRKRVNRVDVPVLLPEFLNIPEFERALRARLNADRLKALFEPVETRVALRHFVSLFIKLRRAVGAGLRAVPVPDALIGVDDDQPVLRPLVVCARRARLHAGGV